MENPTSAFNLTHIILLEVVFNRESDIANLDKQELLTQEVNIDVSHSDLSKDVFSTFLRIAYNVKYDGVTILKTSIFQSANFLKIGSHSEDELNYFANVNAAAIIFPFTREIIASITAKSMVGTILLQPVNFVQIYKDKLAKNT